MGGKIKEMYLDFCPAASKCAYTFHVFGPLKVSV